MIKMSEWMDAFDSIRFSLSESLVMRKVIRSEHQLDFCQAINQNLYLRLP